MDPKNTTTAFFEEHARLYDGFQSAVVPHYAMFIALVAKACRHCIGAGLVLDEGCGSGNVSLRILEESPSSRVFLADGSATMVELARRKVEAQAGEQAVCGTKVADFQERGWHRGLPAPLDAVVSAFVLEHLPEADYKDVIRRNHDLLRKGGAFVSVEWGDDEFGMQRWFKEEMRQRGERHPEYAAYIAASERMERHYFVNIREKIAWLADAGYRNVHTVGQHLFGYVVVGEKG